MKWTPSHLFTEPYFKDWDDEKKMRYVRKMKFRDDMGFDCDSIGSCEFCPLSHDKGCLDILEPTGDRLDEFQADVPLQGKELIEDYIFEKKQMQKNMKFIENL